MHINENSERTFQFIRFATLTLVVAILYVARDVLLPIAFAFLFAFLLSPMVVRLKRWGVPRALAILATVALSMSIISGLGWFVSRQALFLAGALPNYEQNIREKLKVLKNPPQPESLARTSEMVDKLKKELQEPTQATLTADAKKSEPKPVPVEVRAPQQGQFALTREFVSPFLGPLGVAGLVIVLMIAMLFQWEDLRDRFVEVVGAGRINLTTQALDDASHRVAGFLWMQLLVNATYGIPVGLALYVIGVPSALLWGLIATLLRFIPFVGPWIAAIFPVTLAFAVDPGWHMLFWTLALFTVMELVSNNIIEVMLYQKGTGVSNLALLVGAVFWTWLWGAAGLVLATPLTVCLLVLGKYVPGLKFLSMLLGSEPSQEPPVQFYQRLLAEDSDHLLGLASTYLKDHTLTEFYDQVLMPALILAEEDRHKGALTLSRQAYVFQSSRELIEELDGRGAAEEIEKDESEPRPEPPAMLSTRILGVPASDEADEIAALMLQSLLRARGHGVAVSPLTDRRQLETDPTLESGVKAIFVSALPPSTLVAARQACRRLRATRLKAPIVLGVWARNTPAAELQARLGRNEAHVVVTTLAAAMEKLEAILAGGTVKALEPGETPTTPNGEDATGKTVEKVKSVAPEESAIANKPQDVGIE